jgi:Fe-S oxidoreductase
VSCSAFATASNVSAAVEVAVNSRNSRHAGKDLGEERVDACRCFACSSSVKTLPASITPLGRSRRILKKLTRRYSFTFVFTTVACGTGQGRPKRIGNETIVAVTKRVEVAAATPAIPKLSSATASIRCMVLCGAVLPICNQDFRFSDARGVNTPSKCWRDHHPWR